MLITASIFFELFIVFSIRSSTTNIRNMKPNTYLNLAVLISVVLQLVVIYTPLNAVFHFVPLGIVDRLRILGIGMTGLIVFESIKFFRKRKSNILIQPDSPKYNLDTKKAGNTGS